MGIEIFIPVKLMTTLIVFLIVVIVGMAASRIAGANHDDDLDPNNRL